MHFLDALPRRPSPTADGRCSTRSGLCSDQQRPGRAWAGQRPTVAISFVGQTTGQQEGSVRLCAYSALATLGALGFLYTASRAAEPEKPFGLEQRIPWSTSRLVGTPDPPPPYRLTRVFPQLSFKGPVFIAQDPVSDRLFVAEYDGRIYSFLPNDATGRKDL